jgi:hypothetical protein
MWDWQRILSSVIVIVILVIRYESFQRASDFWGTLPIRMIPVALSIACIWFPDALDEFFDRRSPSALIRVMGWVVLVLYLGVFLVQWRASV